MTGRIGRRSCLTGAVAAMSRALGLRSARADQSLRLLIASASGSGGDQEARAYAPFLERHLPGAEIEPEDMPGEGGLVAFRQLAAAPADGATLGWVTTPSLPARMVEHGLAGMTPQAAGMPGISLLGAVQKEPIALVSPATAALASAQDLFSREAGAAALPLGTPPAGSPPHLAALRLQALAGARLNIVVFPSAAAAREAVLAGNVAAAALALGDAIAALRDGRLAGLGITANHRVDAFPDMPPLGDAGLPLSAFILRGLAAPAGLPQATAARLLEAMQAVVADPDYHAQGDASGFSVLWLDGDAWTAHAEAERVELTRLWQAAPWRPLRTW
ncbi:MAG: hypothetical protein JO264_07595 [Acidisphaera sp.]|nr:hypothetical protein [Acidisphaera sp.]